MVTWLAWDMCSRQWPNPSCAPVCTCCLLNALPSAIDVAHDVLTNFQLSILHHVFDEPASSLAPQRLHWCGYMTGSPSKGFPSRLAHLRALTSQSLKTRRVTDGRGVSDRAASASNCRADLNLGVGSQRDPDLSAQISCISPSPGHSSLRL